MKKGRLCWHSTSSCAQKFAFHDQLVSAETTEPFFRSVWIIFWSPKRPFRDMIWSAYTHGSDSEPYSLSLIIIPLRPRNKHLFGIHLWSHSARFKNKVMINLVFSRLLPFLDPASFGRSALKKRDACCFACLIRRYTRTPLPFTTETSPAREAKRRMNSFPTL